MPNPERDRFLISMYEQMWGNINRQITLSWQPLTVVVGIVAALKAALDGDIPFGMATTFGIIALTWFMAHLYDSNRWFYRNHAIIANLENHFSQSGDKEKINPFMGDLVPPDAVAKFLSTFRVHRFLAGAAGISLLLVDFLGEVVPAVTDHVWPQFAGQSYPYLLFLPVIGLLVCCVYLNRLRASNDKQYTRVYDLGMAGRK